MPTLPPYMISKPTTYVVGATGRLVAPYSIEAVVYDVSTDAKRATPVQVFPAPTGRYTLVPGDEIAVGYYSVPYVADPAEPKGRRLVRWFVTLEVGDPEMVWTTEWEVLAITAPKTGPMYALVSDLRDEGFTLAQLPDFRAQMILQLASRLLERFTGRSFVPVLKSITMDGTGSHAILLNEPIVAITSIAIDDDYYTGVGTSTVSELIRVYNRHLTENLIDPDDRNDPKVEFFHADGFRPNIAYGSRLVFPRGQKNTHLDGVFGYTEYDGSPMGKTPEMIRYVTILLARRLYGQVGDPNAGSEQSAWRVIREKTRDQAVDYSDPGGSGSVRGSAMLGAFTGDPVIDSIIAMHVRQPAMSAA